MEPRSASRTGKALPRVRPDERGELYFDCERIEQASAQVAALRAIAFEAAPRQARSLIEARLRRYEWCVSAREGGAVRAFILGQTRWIDGAVFFYFGPLYSTRGAYLPLFAHALRLVCGAPPPWWLLAEIEHPRLQPLFQHLIPQSWPRSKAPLSLEVAQAARRLAATLGHIESLDEATLNTICNGAPAQLVVVQATDLRMAATIRRELESALLELRRGSAKERAVAP